MLLSPQLLKITDMNQHMQQFHQEAFNTDVTGVTDKEETKPSDNLYTQKISLT